MAVDLWRAKAESAGRRLEDDPPGAKKGRKYKKILK